MDWQLIIDPGMVLQYMAKYVTKSDNSQSKNSHRMIRNLFDKTVTDEGRSTQAFLRCVMSKFMQERVLSKQETCHLLLGLPIVHCTHKLLNINLENTMRKFIEEDEDETPTAENNDADNDEEGKSVLVMSLIDAYAVRCDKSKWVHGAEFDAIEVDLQSMNLFTFCQLYKVGQQGHTLNLIYVGGPSHKVVVNFYPKKDSDPKGQEYVEFCKYSLMKYRSWEDSHKNAWCIDGDEESTTDEDITSAFTALVQSFGTKVPRYIEREINNHNYKKKRKNGDEDGAEDVMRGGRDDDEDFSNGSNYDANEKDFLEDLGTQGLNHDQSGDDMDDLDIEWDEEHSWKKASDIGEDMSEWHDIFEDLKSSNGIESSSRKVIDARTLNEKQKQAHDMIVSSCISTEESSTDIGGKGIGRLQMLLGSGGCGKSYVIDAVIMTLEKVYDWDMSNIGVFATTGKAATNIGGSTIQNYTTGLGFYSGS